MSRPIVATVALLVLLSTLAGVAGAAPSTGVRADNESLTPNGAAGQLAADGNLRSSGSYWSGERLAFDASEIAPGDASEEERTFELWRVTSDGQLNQQVRTFTVAGNGTYRLETADLAGRYVVRYGEQVVYVHEGVGYLQSPPDGSEVSVDAAAFELSRQTLSFDYSDPSVYPGQQLTLTFTSNRADYTVAVSGGNLTFDELTAVFPETAYAESYDARADQDILLLQASATTRLDLDTIALEPGRGSFEFDVVDAAAAETTDLDVLTPDDDGRFVSLERRENVGDVVESNVSCTSCFLVVGGPGQGILDVVELEDEDGDGHVTLRINTRYAGMQTSRSGYPSGVDAYTSPEDDVSRYSSSATLERVREELNYNVVTLDDLRDEQGVASMGRLRPLPPGPVDLRLTTSDFLINRSSYGSGPPYGGQLVVRDETDVRTVTLEPRALSEAATLAAPSGPRLPQNEAAIRSTAGPRDSVSLGDHLVFRFDVSGVFGYLHEAGVSAETIESTPEEGIRLRLEASTDAAGSETLSLSQTAARIYADPAADSLYLAVQTGGTSRTNLQEGRYRATLTLAGVDAKHDEYSTSDAYTGYPYLPPGETESASASATVEPPTAAISSPEEGSSPHVNANWSLVVGGTTSLAPGGEVRLEATATEYAWDTTATATVNETGHWTGSLNLTEAPGDEFTVTLFHEDTQFDERTYTVRPPLQNESGEGGSGGDGGGSDGGQAGGIVPDDGTLSGLAGLAVPVGGGIGVLVLVWAAWKLVIRRLLI